MYTVIAFHLLLVRMYNLNLSQFMSLEVPWSDLICLAVVMVVCGQPNQDSEKLSPSTFHCDYNTNCNT